MLEYIFYLGIVYVAYGFVWAYVFALPIAALLTLLRLDKGILVVRAVGCYVLVSLVTLITLVGMEFYPSTTNFILFPAIGAFTLFVTFSKGAYDSREEAMREYDYELLRSLRYDGILTLGSLILFIVALFVPVIAINPLIQLLFKIIDWAYNLKVIGWVIRIIGVLFMLNIIWYGILGAGILIAFLVGKIKGERKNES